jgi:hypothetical protein
MEEMIMKIRTLAIVTLFALASTAYASATYHKHRQSRRFQRGAKAPLRRGFFI